MTDKTQDLLPEVIYAYHTGQFIREETKGATKYRRDDICAPVPCAEVPINKGEISDGYHTFNELYEHRHRLFIAMCNIHQALSWKSRLHDDGSKFDGWFVGGLDLPSGLITYHLPDRLWDDMYATAEIERGKFDGHTSNDVLERLKNWGNKFDYEAAPPHEQEM